MGGDKVQVSSYCLCLVCLVLCTSHVVLRRNTATTNSIHRIHLTCAWMGIKSRLQNARNVLVSSNLSAVVGLTAKLADFGLSRIIKQQQTHRTTKTCGTMSHMVSVQQTLACSHTASAAVHMMALGCPNYLRLAWCRLWMPCVPAVMLLEATAGHVLQCTVVHGHHHENVGCSSENEVVVSLLGLCWCMHRLDCSTHKLLCTDALRPLSCVSDVPVLPLYCFYTVYMYCLCTASVLPMYCSRLKF